MRVNRPGVGPATVVAMLRTGFFRLGLPDPEGLDRHDDRSRALQRRWDWAVLPALLGSIPAFYLDLLEPGRSALATLLYLIAAAVLATEGVTLQIAPDAIRRIAQIAYDVNERTENIGARRLATVMERLLDDVSFDAPNRGGQTIRIDAAAVDDKLADLAKDVDLSRYIL